MKIGLFLSFFLLASVVHAQPALLTPEEQKAEVTGEPTEPDPQPDSAQVNELEESPMATGGAEVAPPPLTPPLPLADPQDFKPDFKKYDQMLRTKYSLFSHHRTYVMPFSHIWNPNQDLYAQQRLSNPSEEKDFYRRDEAEFQISFFLPIYRKIAKTNWDFLLAYSNRSWWQVYNAAWSKPFRETNHNPELFFRRLNDPPRHIFGIKSAAYDLGYMHESNGQMQGLSRSWDRLFARAFFVNGSLSVIVTAWLRLPEAKGDDDNRDILRYNGVGQVEVQKALGSTGLELKVQASERPGAELRVSFPWHNQLRWFVMGNYGYGQSLVEYNQEVKRFGIGLMLENFLDNGSRLKGNRTL